MRKGVLSEFASLVGLSTERARQLRRAGTLTGETVAELVQSYTANLRAQAAGRAGQLNLSDERAALARAQREKLEREAALAKRELLRATEVELAVAALARVIVDALESWPGRLAGPLLGCKDEREAGHLLRSAVFDIRTELAAAIERGDVRVAAKRLSESAT